MKNGRYVNEDSNQVCWYLNDQLHREDGPALENSDGTKEWYLNDQLHREDGPALELASGNKSWWINGKRHREDGPAIELASGTKSWFLNGEQLTESEFNQWLMKKELNEKLHATFEPRPTEKRLKI